MGTRITTDPEILKQVTKKSRSSTNGGVSWGPWSYADVYQRQKYNTVAYKEGANFAARAAVEKSGLLLPHMYYMYNRQYTENNPGTFKYIIKTTALNWQEVEYNEYYLRASDSAPYWGGEYMNPLLYHDYTYAKSSQQAAAAAIYNGGVDGMTFLAELRKTRQMLANAARTVMKMNAACFRGEVRNAPSLWLEARYGWRPLLSELKNISQQLEKTSQIERKIFKEYKNKVYDKSSGPHVVTDNTGGLNRTATVNETVTCSARGFVTALVEVEGFTSNSFQTAWELIPYSFIADWFYGVGDAIGSASLGFNADQIVTSVGFKVEINRSRTFTMTKGSSGSYHSMTHSVSSNQWMLSKFRMPATLPLAPQARVKIDTLKIADLCAMAANRLLSYEDSTYKRRRLGRAKLKPPGFDPMET